MTPEVFELFYRDHYARHVKRMTRHLRGDRDAAEDIVAMSYEKMWRYRDSFNPEKSGLTQWFNSILYNTLRSELSSKIELEEQGFEERPSLIPDAIDQVKNPAHQTVLRLHLMEGYTEAQIKRLLGGAYKSGDVRKIVFRFRKKLKEQYATHIGCGG